MKYQGSALGFTWSLANPLLTLAVYSLVFGLIFKSGIPEFGFYLMTGLLIWNAFSSAVSSACGAVIGNAGLVKKVPFPLTVLPLSSVAFAIVHYILQMLVLVVVMASFGRADHWDAGLFLMFPSFAVAILFTLAISFLVAAVNVRYRDTSHVVEVVLIAGMWLNPIVYSLNQLRGPLIRNHLWDIYFLNPIADVILSMQRAFYGSGSVLKSRPGPVHAGGLAPDGVLPDEGLMFYVERLAIGGLISVVLLVLFYRLYNKMSADFAEEL